MKFIQYHRKTLFAVMERHGLAPTDFDFVKRKGRIQLIHRTTGKAFTYFRKKQTHIDPDTKQWVERESFLISSEGSSEEPVDHWDRVVSRFDRWIRQLRR